MSTFSEKSSTSDGRDEAVGAYGLNSVSNQAMPIIGTNAAMSTSVVIADQQVQRLWNELLSSMKPFVQNIASAGTKIVSETVSQIMGPIWDEFDELSPLGKLFAVLGTAFVAGVVGYCSWKLIAGNWPTIQEYIGTQLKRVGELISNKKIEDAESQFNVAKIIEAFESREEDVGFNVTDAAAVIEYFCKIMGQGFMQGFLEVVKKANGA